MSRDSVIRRRYLGLTLTYLVMALTVIALTAGIYGLTGLALALSGAIAGFGLFAIARREAMEEFARQHYEEDCGTRRVVVGNIAVGVVVIPLLVVFNFVLFNLLFTTEAIRTVVGSASGAIFGLACGALAARYLISSRAHSPAPSNSTSA